MRYYGRRAPYKRKKVENSFWLSFADLMSALLLMFVLVLFYVLYQLLARSDELTITTAQLLLQQEQVVSQQLELEEKDKDLQASQTELAENKQELALEQANLIILQKKNEDAQSLLQQQQEELDNAMIQLSDQQQQMDQQQTLLTEQQQKMSDQQQKLDALVGIRTLIIASLRTALDEANVKVSVDQSTGAITLDSSVLFDSASSELKDSGKRMLDQFLPVYLSVLLDSEFSPNISEIIIEGHTDTDGGYEFNLELSNRRAMAVMQYILSDEYTKISSSVKNTLRKIATPTGRSYTNPVTDPESGEIDKEASRRVEFKFRLQDEQMIESMRELLENIESINP